MSEVVAFEAAAAHSPAVHAALGRAAGALIVPLGRQWGRRLRGDAETRALRQAAADARTRSIEHARQPDIAAEADEAWWELIANWLADAAGDQRLARELVRFSPGEGTHAPTVAALRQALATGTIWPGCRTPLTSRSSSSCCQARWLTRCFGARPPRRDRCAGCGSCGSWRRSGRR